MDPRQEKCFWMRIVPETYSPFRSVEFEFHGELDISTTRYFWDTAMEVSEGRDVTVRKLLSTFDDVYLDLRHVTFIDCSGVQLILDLVCGGKVGHCFVSALPESPKASNVFAMTHTLAFIPIKSAHERDEH